MFLILSTMTALLECGSIFLGKCLGYSPGGILSLCLAYQFGNLFPIPFCLRRKTLLTVTYLAFVMLCIARFLDTRPLFQWTFYLIGIMMLSCTIQSVRAEMKVQTSTVRKRAARIVGFTLAPLMMYAPFPVLSVCCLIVLFSLKHTIQVSASDSSLSSRFKSMIKNDCYKIMLWHQLHYFIYAYAMILIVYQITGKPFQTMLLFACTWLTYLITEPFIKYACRSYPKLIYNTKSMPGNTIIILIGHTFLLLILLMLPNVSTGVFIPLWILAGFGGGTVFAISALCNHSLTYQKEELTFTENIGHFVGTAMAVIWISLFPQNIRHISYLSAICVFVVLLLSIKKIIQERRLQLKIQTVEAKNLIVKSNLPASDYVVNPYIGCSHQCRYCYASFMKRFTGHPEAWGTFVDIKQCSHMKLPHNLSQKTLLFSSVTDPYQPLEKKYGATGDILKQLIGIPAKIEILTKSYLVTQDINLFKQLSNIRIGISMNSLDDSFRKDMEPGASSVVQRIKALRELHEAGLSTYAFISPIFPGITDIEHLVDTVAAYVEEICFENLNLRGVQTQNILSYIRDKYPSLVSLYQNIYVQHQMDYWETQESLIHTLESQYSIKFTNYFYHNKIKKGSTK